MGAYLDTKVQRYVGRELGRYAGGQTGNPLFAKPFTDLPNNSR